MSKTVYQIVKHQHITEKSVKGQTAQGKEGNLSSLKYTFIVDRNANKHEIADAVEKIYLDKEIKVVSVNTMNNKEKARRVRGRAGFKSAFKKAVVTLRPGDRLENV